MNDNRYFYEKCRNAVEQAFETQGTTLVDALPALGKSTKTIDIIAERGDKAVIFTARHELYDQLEDECKKNGITGYILPSFHRDCTTGGKEETRKYGQEWARRFRSKYAEGHSAKELHQKAHEHFGEELPCQSSGKCEYISRLEHDLSEYQVLIGNYQHMFNSAYSDSRIIVLDEFPGNSVLDTLEAGDANKAVSWYLSQENSLPLSNIKDILSYRINLTLSGAKETDEETAVNAWLAGSEGSTYDSIGWYREEQNPNTTAYGRLLVRAALIGREIPGGWTRSELDDGTVILKDENGEVSILPPRPFDEKANIVALDGTLSLELWRAILGNEIEYQPTLNDTEKREWLRRLGLRIIQTTEKTVPVRGWRNAPETDYTLIEEVTRREGKTPFVVSSKQGLKRLNALQSDDLTWDSEHYDRLVGRNDLDGRNPVLLIGSPQLSDSEIQKWAAIRGEAAVPAKDESGNRLGGKHLDFGPVGNDILHATREDMVLQAAMRFSREPRSTETRIYIYSCTIPEWVQPDVCEMHVTRRDGNRGLGQVVHALTYGDDWRTAKRTTTEITDLVKEIYGEDARGYDQILKHLKRLNEEWNMINCEGQRPFIWSNRNLGARGKYGFVSIVE